MSAVSTEFKRMKRNASKLIIKYIRHYTQREQAVICKVIMLITNHYRITKYLNEASMTVLKCDHFERAAFNIDAHDDNNSLPLGGVDHEIE